MESNTNPKPDADASAKGTDSSAAAQGTASAKGTDSHDVAAEANWSPDFVKSLPPAALPALAQALRARILETVSANGGHLASNLGVIELTIALLRVFSPPADKILFDVSHQSYAYKLLTGRAARFGTLRTLGGLSGFQKRDEGDPFGSGHAGNTLSAALGLAAARDRAGGSEYVVAVIGDASISNGVSLEALNNAVATTKQLVIVLNDNEMSISRNVGAMAKLFSKMLTNPRLVRAKIAAERFGVEKLRMGGFRARYRHFKASIKRLFLRNALFEDLGFQYIGPIDGHDLRWLRNALDKATRADRPVIVHVATVKGRGYRPAEENPSAWHGTPPFDLATGRPRKASPGPSWSAVFGEALCKVAREDARVCALTAAMCDGTGLDAFAREFPDRFFDVGIAEEHEGTFAAGLAAAGLRPVVAVYSTFFQRAVDALIHDAALQHLPVVFCLDRAGIVANDGPTHHGVFDIALARPVPGVTIMQPSDADELEAMLRLALTLDGPSIVRYPRGAAEGARNDSKRTTVGLALGKARIVEQGGKAPFAALWALGDMLPAALETARLLAARGIAAELVDARFVKPLDTALLADELARGAALFATFENAVATGGLGTAVGEALMDARSASARHVLRFGWPDDEFVPHAGSNRELFARFGLTPEAMAERIAAAWGNAI